MKPRASTERRLTRWRARHTLSGMTPLGQAVVLICAVAHAVRGHPVTSQVSTLVGAVSTVTRAGRIVALAAGLRKGLSVFASRLRDTSH